jgi:uncharacterized membrane protein
LARAAERGAAFPRTALDADQFALTSDPAIGWACRTINLQLAVFVLIPTFAALMARGSVLS